MKTVYLSGFACTPVGRTRFNVYVHVHCSSLAKKTKSVIQTLRKDGVLTAELEQDLRSCRSADELDHVVRMTFLC